MSQMETVGVPQVDDSLKRNDSGAYWAADGWDPEERVYTGAESGMANHLMAVKPKDRSSSQDTESYKESTEVGVEERSSRRSSGSHGSQSQTASVSEAMPSADNCPLSPPPPCDLPRRNSGEYWNADSWDPEERIYVGAAGGAGNHLIAVQPKEGEGSAHTERGPFQRRSTVAGTPLAKASASLLEESDEPVRRSSDGYWGASTWDPEERVYVGASAGMENHLVAEKPSGGQATPGVATAPVQEPQEVNLGCDVMGIDMDAGPAAGGPVERGSMGSNCYWDADAWDPEQRVYVGADSGMTHHRTAVEPKEGEKGAPQPEEPVSPPTSPTSDDLPKRRLSCGSDGYWGADGWDPEERVYTGAHINNNHHMAVRPEGKADAKPGLAARRLGHPLSMGQ